MTRNMISRRATVCRAALARSLAGRGGTAAFTRECSRKLSIGPVTRYIRTSCLDAESNPRISRRLRYTTTTTTTTSYRSLASIPSIFFFLLPPLRRPSCVPHRKTRGTFSTACLLNGYSPLRRARYSKIFHTEDYMNYLVTHREIYRDIERARE